MANLFFDLDGTIIDSRPGITRSLQHALKTIGQPVPSENDLLWCIGPPLINSLRKIVGAENESLAQEALKQYRIRYGETGCYENEVYPGIADSIAYLDSLGHQLYVVTAKPTVFAKKIFERLTFGPLFKEVYGSGLDGQFNDKADLIRHVMGQHSLSPTHTWMIGDREHDMIAAKKNRVGAIGVLWGYGDELELMENGANFIVKQPSDLVANPPFGHIS